jgi:hypothetical protein
MKNLGETISIGHGAREEDGTKLEPELQPVIRRIESESGVSLGNDHVGTPIGRSLPLRIVSEMPAIEAAEVMSRRCELCAHFRTDLWPSMQREFESTHEGRVEMDKIRGHLLGLGANVIPSMINGEEIHDVEHALSRMGVCDALSTKERPIIPLPESCCPEGYEDTFQPKAGGTARRAVTSIRDRILKAASRRFR